MRNEVLSTTKLVPDSAIEEVRGVIEAREQQRVHMQRALVHSRPECQHAEKVILVAGDTDHVARETWCPVCGYKTSCYQCYLDAMTTERCGYHR